MRFDLELNIVDVLTLNGLEKASLLLYSQESSEITPMVWDTKALSVYKNSGSINTSGFNNLEKLDDDFIFSGVSDTSNLGVSDILEKDGNKYLLLNGGDIYSHRDSGSFSLNTIYSGISYSNGYYSYKLDNDFDISTIDIFTLTYLPPGYFKKSKVFGYVEYDSISLTSTFDKDKTKKYSYTIVEDTVFLNVNKIQYSNILLGKVSSANKIFSIPELPVENFSLKDFDQSSYSVYNGLLILNKEQDREIIYGEDMVASFDVTPVISFKQKTRASNRDDLILAPNSIDLKSLNFNNGVICIYQNYNTYSVPTKLETKILNTGTIRFSDSINVESRITGFSDVPLANKEINISITSNNASWQGGGVSFTGVTGIDGTIKASLKPSNAKVGVYIQKEWMRNIVIDGALRGQIILPYKHPSFNSLSTLDKENVLNTIYLYTIQNDDPILGKMNASFSEEGINEFYNGNDISDYTITGRKIAYIKLSTTSNTIYSTYIKPINIELTNNVNLTFRDLYTYDKDKNISGIISNKYFDSTLISSEGHLELGTKYKSGVLPFDILTRYNRNFEEATVITYESPLPLSNGDITGLWLVSDEFITVVSSFSDSQITLTAEQKIIRVKSVESESPFILTGYSMDGFDTKTNSFGYLTATEYIKNPFGLKSCSYYCTYSDAINKKCIHPSNGFRKYFTLDSESIGCQHTPEYDQTIALDLRCPGVDAHIINPFILTTL